MWIAVEGLKAPVPEPWRAIQYANNADEIYYMNMQNGVITHEHPLDVVYRDRVQQEKKLKEQQNRLIQQQRQQMAAGGDFLPASAGPG